MIEKLRLHGPILLQDCQLPETLWHQNRERLPERTVHPKSRGTRNTFTLTNDMSRYTEAFSQIGKKDRYTGAIFDRGWRERRCRCSTRRA